MPNNEDINDEGNPGLPISNFAKGSLPEGSEPTAQSELDEALARIADPELRAHFERLLTALGHRP